MNSQTTIAALLREIEAMLAESGIAPGADAELLLGHVLGESRGGVQAAAIIGRSIGEEDRDAALSLASERARRVPLQHLTGKAPFRGIELEVGPGVFVPRPETETVAQFAIDAMASEAGEAIAIDLCTGSGALALAIAQEVPEARVWAVEKSPEAHAWASRNVAAWGEGHVELLLGDVRELEAGPGDPLGNDPLGNIATALEALRGRVRVLVSNPPYVPSGMVPRDPEVRDHDPELALYGGRDGLDLVRVISRVGLGLVAVGGAIVLEHAEQQGAAIRALLTADGWGGAETYPDLTGRDRATVAILP